MQVDDAFVLAVMARVGDARYPIDIIAATLAVAAERGMVVPDGAPKMWAVTDTDGRMHAVSTSRRKSEGACAAGETVVRVAVVEIKGGLWGGWANATD